MNQEDSKFGNVDDLILLLEKQNSDDYFTLLQTKLDICRRYADQMTHLLNEGKLFGIKSEIRLRSVMLKNAKKLGASIAAEMQRYFDSD